MDFPTGSAVWDHQPNRAIKTSADSLFRHAERTDQDPESSRKSISKTAIFLLIERKVFQGVFENFREISQYPQLEISTSRITVFFRGKS